MKNSWLVYVTVAAISALAGVVIAGPPNTVGTEATIVVPETTTTTTITAPESTVAPQTTEAEPERTTTTEAPDTTTTTEPAPDIDRAVVGVVAVNGAGVGGLATRVRNELRDLGFERTRSADGTEFVDDTTVYFAAGFEAEAAEVAEALGVDAENVQPIDGAPAFGVSADDQVAVYLGRDRA